MGNIVNLNQLTALARLSTDFSKMGGDYLMTHLTSSAIGKAVRLARMGSIDRIEGPIRIEGMAWLMCESGSIDIEINLTPVHLPAGSIAVLMPGSMIEIKNVDQEHLDCYLLAVSTEFMRDINFDLNALGSGARISRGHRRLLYEITPEEIATLKEYFSLLRRNGNSEGDPLLIKSIARCLIAALSYQQIQMAALRTQEEDVQNKSPRSRRTIYVNEFMQLVHEYHVRERSLTFYAQRLFISPKYLSLIIKECTGHSATEVIDSFVILEAKNMLRFSGKNIQQIAYDLNFPNQSSFGKYFKHLTGMSPSEYQRS